MVGVFLCALCGVKKPVEERRSGRGGCKPCEAKRDRAARAAQKALRDPLSGLKTGLITPPTADRFAVFGDELMREIRVPGNLAGVWTADWHLPITDYRLWDALVEDAIAQGCTDYLVAAGDLFNWDALSDYAPKQDDAGLEPELVRANQLFRDLLSVFERIYISKGNHDVRLLKALGWKLKFEHSLNMILFDVPAKEKARIEATGRDYVIVDQAASGGYGHSNWDVEWRLCHTAEYSRTPLAIPGRLADIHRCAVGGAHRHHHALGFSPSGYPVLEMGGMFDASRTEYLQQWTKTFPKWSPGYTLRHADGSLSAPLLTGQRRLA